MINMLTNMKELSVFVLLMLASLSEGKPLQRTKRAIMKDYFNPLTYPTDKLKFEKGEDGKFHAQELGDSIHSKVDYVVAHDIDASNEIIGDVLKSSEKTIKADNSAIANTEKVGLNPESSAISKFKLQKEGMDLSTKVLTADKGKTEVNETNQEKVVSETTAKLDSEMKAGNVASKEHEMSAKLDIPVDSKWSLVPKPDGKDDKPYEGGEEYLPEPPVAPEEKDDEGKVEIGQIPKHHPVFVPPNIPLLIPKRISFRMLSLLPKPPAIDISDRLPLPEPEVVEESSETAVVENISPRGPMVIKGGTRFVANHLLHPLRIGLQLPFLPIAHILKEAAAKEKLKGQAKSQIVDIGGRKMLLQKKILMSPHHDPSLMHVSVMSIQPLDDVDPEILKDLDQDEKELESEEARLEKDLKLDGKKEAEKRSVKDDKIDAVVTEEEKKGTDMISKHIPQPETLDKEKTVVIEEKTVDDKVPPPEAFAPVIPAIFIAAEGTKKEEKEGVATKEFEAEPKLKEDDIKKAEESHTVKESGLKTEIQTESKLDENMEKNKNKEIIPVSPEEKEEEKTISVVEKEKDVLIGTEDLLKFRDQIENQETPSIDSFKKEAEEDLMTGEFVFEKESQSKDEEVAQSKRVEVTLKPEEGTKYILAIEGKKGDEGMLEAEDVAASSSGTEFAVSKHSEADILKDKKIMTEDKKATTEDKKATTEDKKATTEDKKATTEDKKAMTEDKKAMTEDKKNEEVKLSMEETLDSRSATKITTGEEAEEKTDMKFEFRELHEESMIEKKKGDDEILNSKKDAASHVATEIITDKDAKEKTDIINVQHSEESIPKTEGFGLTKSEGAVLEERKKKFEEGKDKSLSKKKKRKCKCEDSDESDSEDEDDIE
ncbi:eukaryotic translation initiation factor 5B-like [Argiope bruennichi]|uniref:Uncharacterized protein n=1 Tax=Argiope bruennichi TaxID=94029 RepID=A0A8T0FXD6_ARGBR|nr:eukaryotic translation initiation factor 5B-like [Argiope bruennichi]KAF8795731.1 hypothetical protein HNY73_000198 [Argiope bruennichi]